jgi:hypothetical protein
MDLEPSGNLNFDTPDKLGYPNLSDLSEVILDFRINPMDKSSG